MNDEITGPFRRGPWVLFLDVGSLRRDAWVLARDGGSQLALSRAESALVACLLTAGGRGVPVDVLTRAVLRGWRGPENRQRRRSAELPVMIGRLRMRGRRAGLTIPIVRCPQAAAYAWAGRADARGTGEADGAPA